MNPMLLEMIQQLLTSQGGAFGLPGAGAGSAGPMGQVFQNIREYMDEEQSQKRNRLNVDPLRDIEPFRVNAFRGFLAEEGGMVEREDAEAVLPMSFMLPSGGSIMDDVRNRVMMQSFQNLRRGGMAGDMSLIPASVQMDTINNTPSNLPGGAGGKFDISQVAVQNDAFSIPKTQPFVDPIFGNKLFDVQNNQIPTFKEGGFVQTLIVDDDELTHRHLDLLDLFEKGKEFDRDLVYVPVQFAHGGPVKIYGVEKAFLGKLIKGIGKGLGKIGKGIFEGVKGSADFLLGNLGMPDIIDNSFVDRSKFLSGLNKVTGTIGRGVLDILAPGAGSAIGLIGSQLNRLGQNRDDQLAAAGQAGIGQAGTNPMFQPQIQGSGIMPIGGSLFNRINQQGVQAPVVPRSTAPRTGGLFTGGQFSQPGPFALGNIFGGGGMMSVPGFAGGMFNIPRGGGSGPINAVDWSYGLPPNPNARVNLPYTPGMEGTDALQLLRNRYGGRVPSYQEGGLAAMPLIPIQTEKVGKQPEMIIHVDGSITPVNATKRHSQMDEDEVTDIVPEGSYITSADKSMKIAYDTADDIVIGVKALPYNEMKQGKVPEEITLAGLWGKGDKKPKTPAELAMRLSKKMPVIDMDDTFEHGADIFTKRTNMENLQNRVPYLSEIVRLNEEQRVGGSSTGQVQTFKHGGPLTIPGIPHAQFGETLGKILEFLPTALPAISSLFGGARRTQQGVGGISPMVSSGILATIPQYQIGVNQNIGAQSGALNQAVEDFSSLGNQLIQNAQQSSDIQLAANQQGVNLALQGQDALGRAALGSAGLGALGAFMTPTEQERLNLGAARSRINNFRPRSASRAAIDAAATPQIDQQALAAMGPRAAPLIAQAESDRMRAANQAAIQRNQFLDQAEQNRIAQLNALDQQEATFNIGQAAREQDLQRAANQQLVGSLQQGVQQAGGIEANRFGIQGQGVQRAADLQSGLLGQMGQIQSQILPITTQFALQNAQLAGQPNMLAAQNALNAFTTLGGIQSQNALAQQLPQNLGGVGLQPMTSALANLIGGQSRLPSSDAGIEPSSRDEFEQLRRRLIPDLQPIGIIPQMRMPQQIPNLGGTPIETPLQSLPASSLIPPVVSQSQGNPFCRNGIHMVTGQPC